MQQIDCRTKIGIFFGKNQSPAYLISSAIFVLILFFYVFSTASFFQVDVSPFENRVNYHKSFLTFVFDKQIDKLVLVVGTASWLALSLSGRKRIFIPVIYIGLTGIASLVGSNMSDIAVLFSLPLVLSLLIYNHFTSFKILVFSRNLALNYLAVLFTILSFVSVIVSSAPLFSLQSDKMPAHDYANDIYLLFGSFSSILMIILIMGSPVKLLLGKYIHKIFKIETKPLVSDSEKKSRNTIPLLLLIVLLSIILSLVPHYPAINGDNQEVGSDSGDYVAMVTSLKNFQNSTEFLHQAFVVVQNGDRPLTLVSLYVLAKIVPVNPSYVMDHSAIILAPALVLSIFLLTREITTNKKTALFAAFLTAVSFQTLIGEYSGYYANMFALIIGYLSFVFLIRFLKRSGRLNFIIYMSLMIALVFSHVFTWTVLTLVMSIFLILAYKFNHYDKKRMILLFIVILLSVAIDVLRTSITHAHGGISQDIYLAHQGAGLYQFVLSWGNLTGTMENFAGGLFGNFIILILGIYWLVRSNLREPSNLLLAIFLSIGALPLLFGSDLIQSRVFYDIPFQIPAGIALAYLARKINGPMIVLPICIWLFAISLRMVTNFYFVQPS